MTAFPFSTESSPEISSIPARTPSVSPDSIAPLYPQYKKAAPFAKISVKIISPAVIQYLLIIFIMLFMIFSPPPLHLTDTRVPGL